MQSIDSVRLAFKMQQCLSQDPFEIRVRSSKGSRASSVDELELGQCKLRSGIDGTIPKSDVGQ